MTYARAGVDVSQVRKSHEALARRLEFTFRTRKGKVGYPVFPIGHYAGLVDLNDGRVLSLHTDSVGTKVIIAQLMRKYDTIGIDCVAMCANDLICTGTEPITFLDYLAMAKHDRRIVGEIAVGLVEGAEQAGMAIVGGETAIVPDLLSNDVGLDLVGLAAGIGKEKDLILGDDIRKGDALVGVASSGIHSNGLTLARKILLEEYKLTENVPELGRSMGEELLEPTRIYVKPVLEATRKLEITSYTGSIPDYSEEWKNLRPRNVPNIQHGNRIHSDLSSTNRRCSHPSVRETRSQRIRHRTGREKARNSSQR